MFRQLDDSTTAAVQASNRTAYSRRPIGRSGVLQLNVAGTTVGGYDLGIGNTGAIYGNFA